MNTFYSIIKIATLPTSGEVIAVGLLAKHSEGFFLQFSDYKLQIAKLLIGKDEQMVDLVKEQISEKVNQLNEEIALNKPLKEESEVLLKKSYFEYLHQYSNGLLQFSEPFELSIDLTDEKFGQLFGVFVGGNVPKMVNGYQPSVEVISAPSILTNSLIFKGLYFKSIEKQDDLLQNMSAKELKELSKQSTPIKTSANKNSKS